MGFTEVVEHLPRIYGEFRKLKRAIRERRPQVAVLIDFPDFHFRLFSEFHRLGIPVIYFVSPQLWAWKKHRIKQVQKYVRRMLVIFPFEEQFYRDRGVNAEFVGHPLAELPAPTIAREDFALVNSLDPALTWIALLPGSRMREIRDHLPTMLEAAVQLARQNPEQRFEFLIPVAPTLNKQQRSQVVTAIAAPKGLLAFRFISNKHTEAATTSTSSGDTTARQALFHARASIVASGTATVEAALIGNPFVVVYRVSPLTLRHRQARGQRASRCHGQPHCRPPRRSRAHSARLHCPKYRRASPTVATRWPSSRVHDSGAHGCPRGAVCPSWARGHSSRSSRCYRTSRQRSH